MHSLSILFKIADTSVDLSYKGLKTCGEKNVIYKKLYIMELALLTKYFAPM